jgi:hypothetical protein
MCKGIISRKLGLCLSILSYVEILEGELRLIVINCWGKGLIVQTIVVRPSCGAICEGFINWE